MNDDVSGKIFLLLIGLSVLCVVLLVNGIKSESAINRDLCRRLYTDTNEYLKCTTYSVEHTLTLVQPLKEKPDEQRK